MKIRKLLGASLLYVGLAQFASAGLLTFEDNSIAGSYIGNGSSVSSSFDLTSLLDSSLFNSPFEINSAFIQFEFSDDSNDAGFQQDSFVENRTGWGSWYWVDPFFGSDYVRRTFTNYSVTERSSEKERFTATATTDNASQTTTGYASGSIYSTSYSRDDRNYEKVGGPGTYTALTRNNNPFFGGTYTTRTRYSSDGAYELVNSFEKIEDRDWSRDTSAYLFLNNLLGDMSANGTLNYSMSALEGDFLLSKATLHLNIDENPTQQNIGTVPEPSALATFALGLFVMSLRKRALLGVKHR